MLSQLKSYLSMRRGSSHLPQLDGLRGIAILLVLFRHATKPFHSGSDPLLPLGTYDLATPLINGWMGVDLFFVLSGFLITQHILKRRTDGRLTPGGLRLYLTKRILRIVPAYYAFVFIVAAGWIPFYPVSQSHLPGRVAYHLLFLQDYLPSNLVVTFWSLGVEEKFYLTIPLVLALTISLKRLRQQYFALGLLACVPLCCRLLTMIRWPNVSEYEMYFPLFRSPFHVTADGLLLGSLCALLVRDRAHHQWMRNSRVIWALFYASTTLFAALLLRAPLLDLIDLFDKTLLPCLLALSFAGILISLVLLGQNGPALFRSSLMNFFAKISYSLYLVHLVFIPGVMIVMGHWKAWNHFSPGTQFMCFLLPYCAISIVGALILHYSVEKPFLRIKDSVGEVHERKGDSRLLPSRPNLTHDLQDQTQSV
jgi:peptidoglycan/LPS O-acetylase OafA/YrhL